MDNFKAAERQNIQETEIEYHRKLNLDIPDYAEVVLTATRENQ
jgi:hypothetical protein